MSIYIIELFNIWLTSLAKGLAKYLMQKGLFSLLLLIFSSTLLHAEAKRLRCTFNDDPSRTISIAWDQVSCENPILFFDTQARQGNIRDYTNRIVPQKSIKYKGMSNHFVRLNNLQPSSIYYFTIVDSKGQSREYNFETLPDNQFGKLSIIAGGDSRNFRKARISANKMVAKLRPHLVLFGGDMTGGDTAREWIEWMNDWQHTIGEDGKLTPIVVARGNHEYSNRTVVDLFDLSSPNAYYSLNLAGGLLQIYTLNSLIASGGNQSEWLEQSLKRNQYSSIWKMAQYHYPIRPHTRNKGERNNQRKDWATLFHEYGLDLAIESDAHVVKTTYPIRPSYERGNDEGFIRDDDNGTVYIGEGCWGAPLRDNNDDKKWTRASGTFNQFKWIFVDESAIEIRTIKTDNANKVEALCDANRFTKPQGINIWNPPSGDVIHIYREAKNVLALNISQPEIFGFCTNVEKGQCELKWATTNEPAELSFEVQKSIAGDSFRTIAKVGGKGKQSEKNEYKVIDKSLRSNEASYRLVKISASGNTLIYPTKLQP